VSATSDPLALQLLALYNQVRLIRRNLGHVLDESAPAPWRRAAAAALLGNATTAAAMASRLAETQAPKTHAARLIVDARARWLRAAVDRVQRTWSERAGRPLNADLAHVMGELSKVLQRVTR